MTAIGDSTFVGKTAALVRQTGESRGRFAQVLSTLSRHLFFIVLFFLLVIWLSGFYHGLDMTTLLIETLVILIVGVPVGLPAVVTTTMAVGAAQLAKEQHVIVTKLAAIESLAGVDVICFDKTGTLTLNKLTLQDLYPMTELDHVLKEILDSEEILLGGKLLLLVLAALACQYQLEAIEPIDRAILLALPSYQSDSPEGIKTLLLHSCSPLFEKLF